MDIVAEGVETSAQEAALMKLGIKLAQGYLYGRPRPLALAPLKVRMASSG
jgi:EAL domain-containing protein (putative c-di-GMP-specific phosphodiesterase class I)